MDTVRRFRRAHRSRRLLAALVSLSPWASGAWGFLLGLSTMLSGYVVHTQTHALVLTVAAGAATLTVACVAVTAVLEAAQPKR